MCQIGQLFIIQKWIFSKKWILKNEFQRRFFFQKVAVLKIFGSVVGHFWVIFESFLDYFWTIFGLFLSHFWVIFGLFLGYF